MLGDQFHMVTVGEDLKIRDLCSEQHRNNSPDCVGDVSGGIGSHQSLTRSMPNCFEGHHNPVALSLSHTEDSLLSPNTPTTDYSNGRAIRYYQPLMEQYHLNNVSYNNLNQKRESVITFSSNVLPKHSYLDSLDLSEDKHGRSSSDSVKNGKIKSNQVLIDGLPFTIEQIVCICQVLQKADLQKLEKFVYTLPADRKLAKNELILRARAIAAYHSGNYKEVYELLETNNFNVKYHQELQNLWNNAHYKEHEMKRGHPPGAVEKYRIRKKYQFPRTIWDGEEYVYCFKEKNRRVLKEFYQKCNLPTQEDKMKLSSQTQLTVVQISNWFKNRRQRDRQPSHHDHDKASSDAQSNVTNESTTPSPPMIIPSSQGELFPISTPATSHHLHAHHSHHPSQHQGHPHHESMATGTRLDDSNFCLLGQPTTVAASHRPYYFLSQ